MTTVSHEPAADRNTRTGATDWWRHAVIYQVYIRSFADGDGDGTGDIAGMRSRLPYLRDLGVDAVWINPWYTSPFHDGGYDVADYRAIDPRFGTIADAEAFIADAHQHGIRVIVDLVPNHTSNEHEWFRTALAEGPESRAAQRYLFRRGQGADGAAPPNDWPGVFGGVAWTAVTADGWEPGWWYLHLFDHTQPDLNWEHPDVLDEFDSILRFWLDHGVDGFRVDVAHGMCKDPALPDLGDTPQHTREELVVDHPYWDRDELHPIIRRWRSIIDECDDRMFVAEATVHATRRPLYLRPDEYHQAFDFDLLHANWSAAEFHEVIERGHREAVGVGSIPSWVLSNHDKMRHASRYGLPADTEFERWMVSGPHDLLDAELGLRRARAAALLLLGLPGAAYVYQGEELGLPEAWDLPIEVLDDPTWEDSDHERKGRDGCRVPIPWSAEGASLGFGPGDGQPWLPQPDGYRTYAADLQAGVDGSTLELYREALRLRRELLRDDESLTVHSLDGDVLRFDRKAADGTVVAGVVNFAATPIALPDGDVLLVSHPLTADGRLDGNAAAWVQLAPAG